MGNVADIRRALIDYAMGRGMPASTGDIINGFLLNCSIRNLSSHTIRNYDKRLRPLIDLAAKKGGFEKVVRSDLEEFIVENHGRIQASTINAFLRVWRVFFNWIEDEALFDDDWQNPVAKIRGLKVDQRSKEILTPAHIDRLLRSCEVRGPASERRRFVGARDKALILLAYDAMLRLRELRHLRVGDVDLVAGLVHVRRSKARRERLVPIHPRTAKVVSVYLLKHRNSLPGDHLFCTVKGEPMRDTAARNMIIRRGEKVQLKVTPHLIRHSAITEYLLRGGPIAILQRIAGHADIRTTLSHYSHIQDRDAVQFHDKYSPASSLS